jgi:hypothetical protein
LEKSEFYKDTRLYWRTKEYLFEKVLDFVTLKEYLWTNFKFGILNLPGFPIMHTKWKNKDAYMPHITYSDLDGDSRY